MTPNIKVRRFEDADFETINQYTLPDEQAIYTSIPSLIVETFRADKCNEPFVICSEGHVVGWFALYTDQSGNIYTNNEKAILLKSLSIDARHQKKGYALEALRGLPNLVKEQYKDKDEIILTVHETNSPAINLYKKAGFVYKGENYDGEYGIELIFHQDLLKK
ncbi:GNAT family N-acetyltransferase [Fictibacillus arsenicus]|uniref:GNAT family N-acetyltransferase n=1 Tax=Fictibacillus arsenicus TaxID=255247 RepID=A0A1B1Z258_9BACL|nr:GNAT family N-acetyltransferase [Fictibacillus arsenicus]ANX11419.1 GNAT family N-acetyltransferase [Fictibacillus arsenicus]